MFGSGGVSKGHSIGGVHLAHIVGNSPELTKLLSTYSNVKCVDSHNGKEINTSEFEKVQGQIHDFLATQQLPVDCKEALEHLHDEIGELAHILARVRDTAGYIEHYIQKL